MPAGRRGAQTKTTTRDNMLIIFSYRATSIADGLDLGFALIHKERARPNEVSRMVLVGDVKGKVAIIVDDMADTCGTLVKAASVVMEHGAKAAMAIVTHGILSGNAIEALNGSQLTKVVVTNTVPHEAKKERCSRLETIDISPTVRYSSGSGVPWNWIMGVMLIVSVSSWRKHAGEHTMERASRSCSSMRLWTEDGDKIGA